MRLFLVVSLCLAVVSAPVIAQDVFTIEPPQSLQQKERKAKPLSQEEIQERELENAFGTSVERDRIERGGTSETTFDRYGDGTVGVFQNNTSSERNIDDNDSIGINIRLFEFE